MSNIFQGDDRTLEVHENGNKISVHIVGRMNEIEIKIAPSDVPALALAILETAGFEEDTENFGTAVHELGLAIKEQRYIAAEAKEQAELEAEALALFNTLQTEIHGTLGPNWAHVTEFPSGETKRKWLAVARKAREMRSESNGNV